MTLFPNEFNKSNILIPIKDAYISYTKMICRDSSVTLFEYKARNTISSQVSMVHFSKENSLRGLFQTPIGKTITAVEGIIWVVILDSRHTSPTFLKWYGVYLNHINKRQIYIPPNCIYGILCIRDNSIAMVFDEYDSIIKHDIFNNYNTEHLQIKHTPYLENPINFNDPTLDIRYPFTEQISDKLINGCRNCYSAKDILNINGHVRLQRILVVGHMFKEVSQIASNYLVYHAHENNHTTIQDFSTLTGINISGIFSIEQANELVESMAPDYIYISSEIEKSKMLAIVNAAGLVQAHVVVVINDYKVPPGDGTFNMTSFTESNKHDQVQTQSISKDITTCTYIACNMKIKKIINEIRDISASCAILVVNNNNNLEIAYACKYMLDNIITDIHTISKN